MTIKSKNPTVTNVKELGKGAENISAFEAGAIYTISSVETGADDTIAPLIASMFELDIRGADWLAKRGFKTTADMIAAIGEDLAAQHTLEYQERLAWYGKACYKPAEQAIVDAPAPKKTDFETNGEYLDAKETRNNLNSKPAWKMKLLAGRFNTLARQKGEIEVAEKKGADEKKTTLEKIGSNVDTLEKLLQGDGVLPEWFDRPKATAVVQMFRQQFKLPTKNVVNIDDIV
jgi:hypothetical protein|tara:strand:- start:46 stop:738 length:693 start_codon:yes stop_codon:yes gene_type:complete